MRSGENVTVGVRWLCAAWHGSQPARLQIGELHAAERLPGGFLRSLERGFSHSPQLGRLRARAALGLAPKAATPQSQTIKKRRRR